MGLDRQDGKRACLLPAEPHFVSKLPLFDSPLRGDFEQTRFPCPVEFLPREIPEGYFTGARSNRDYSTGVTPMPAAAPQRLLPSEALSEHSEKARPKVP